MGFRIKITLILITVIEILFSLGSTAMIHITFENAMEKEQKITRDTHMMLLKMIQMTEEEGGRWIDEAGLVSVITEFSAQDTVDGILLTREEENLFQRGSMVSFFEVKEEELDENYLFLTCFETDKKEVCLQSSVKIILGSESYHLSLGRKIHDIYEQRDSQIQAFQRIFLLLFLAGFLFFWMISTLMTEPIQKLEQKIILLQENAERKDRFMGAFSHELKTPMTSIIGYADLLRTQKLSDEDREDAIHYIFTEAKRLENMSFKMMDLFVADKKELDGRETDMKKLILYVTDHWTKTYSKYNIRLVTDLGEGSCYVDGDFIQALLINLLDNGRKAMPEGGRIQVVGKKYDSGYQIQIQDEGKGIPPEAMSHLTEAFYRVDKARAREEGSAGLGLALCEKIVRIHHGRMTFESNPGEGTIVTVVLNGGKAHEEM